MNFFAWLNLNKYYVLFSYTYRHTVLKLTFLQKKALRELICIYTKVCVCVFVCVCARARARVCDILSLGI